MYPLVYAQGISPHLRVGRFVADDTQLAWLFPFLKHVPRAEAFVVGGSARDAVRGVLPKGHHLLIKNVPFEALKDELRDFGIVDTLSDHSVNFRPKNFFQHNAIEVSIPFDGQPEPYAPLVYDLGQRDFTMNAMAYSVNKGLLFDPFGGVKDLHNHTLRAVGRPSARFQAKPRRSLRALRLASEHRYQLDQGTWEALKRSLPRLHKVITHEDGHTTFETPREHIGHEFLRLLSGHPHYGLKLWDDSGASNLFTPELHKLHDIRHRGGETSFTRALRTFEDLGHPVPTLAFASLLTHLEDLALEAAEQIIIRLHLHVAHPDFNHDDALWMLKHRNILEDAEPEHMPASTFEHIFGKQRGQHLLSFLHATQRSGNRHTKTRDRLHQATVRRQELVTDVKKPQLLRGRDLENLGVTPGPKYRKILSKIRDAQLDGHIADRDEALNYARNLLATQMI